MNIDWSQLITKAAKEQEAAAQRLARITVEAARLRSIADTAIAPLQDAVDIGEATDNDIIQLKAWKTYRVALNRLPDQPGYPDTVNWPQSPA
ncbi:tail fiber assembly protein [Pseudomonas glycinae]|uniref:tail fiber assembly protein n=1 Tax=Pseudomonas glycinae TaxID=1785145 RepID=UPI002B1E24DC|nr:tail fiber assembly protein [Pseudomonas glycinae]